MNRHRVEAKNLGLRVHENTGHFASRKDPSRDAEHGPRNTGRPGKYGAVGNPKNNSKDERG